MELIADGLLIATALTTGLYCLILSRRLQRLNDSGNGIGAQIASLDGALAETRSALAETREGVTDLRNSARSATARLAQDTAEAAAIATQVERGIERAKDVMTRLYEAGDRVEAHMMRTAGGGGADGAHAGDAPATPAGSDGADAHDADRDGALADDGESDAPDRPEGARTGQAGVPGAEAADGRAASGETIRDGKRDLAPPGGAEVGDPQSGRRRLVALPENSEAPQDDASLPTDVGLDPKTGIGTAVAGRVAGVLKAERVML